MDSSWKKLFASGLAASALATAQTLVDDQQLQDAIVTENLLAHTQALEDIAYATPDRNRFVGTEGHNNTVQYIVEQLEALGGYYDVVLQPFNATVQLASTTSFLPSTGGNLTAEALGYSDSIVLTNTAVVPVANLGCSAADFPSTVSGAIALISRGTCTFADKAFLAKSAGALAAIIYNNVEGVVAGTLGGLNDTLAPAAGVSQADGLALVAAATNGTTPLTANLDIKTDIRIAYSHNVIATTTYATNTSDILFLGAHSDSVQAGPGINDNGSGSAGILEAAIQLAKGGYTAVPTIKFGWWTAEEEGLLGSTAYVNDYASQEELDRIRLYLNYDMIASPNYVLGVYDGDSSEFPDFEPGPAGSAEAEATLVAWFEANGYNSVATAFTGRSDYGPFLEAGIPAGGLFTGAEVVKTEEEAVLFGGTAGAAYDANYHQAGDNATNINAEAFLINSKAIAHTVAFYGAGFEGFPARNTNTTALTKRWTPPAAALLHGHETRHPHAHGAQKKRARSAGHGHDCFHEKDEL